jgi:hypothetical protein
VVLKGGKDVWDEDEAVGGFFLGGSFVEYNIGGAEFKGFCRELITVEIGAFEGKEEIARAELAGVGLDGRVAEIDLVKLFDSHRESVAKDIEFAE